MSTTYTARDVNFVPYRSKKHPDSPVKLGGQFSYQFIAALAVKDEDAIRLLAKTAAIALWNAEYRDELDENVRSLLPDDFFEDETPIQPEPDYVDKVLEAFAS